MADGQLVNIFYLIIIIIFLCFTFFAFSLGQFWALFDTCDNTSRQFTAHGNLLTPDSDNCSVGTSIFSSQTFSGGDLADGKSLVLTHYPGPRRLRAPRCSEGSLSEW